MNNNDLLVETLNKKIGFLERKLEASNKEKDLMWDALEDVAKAVVVYKQQMDSLVREVSYLKTRLNILEY